MIYVDIEKRFSDFHLKAKFSFNNEKSAILGNSGSGKSLILKCIAGVEKPDAGKIIIDDQVVFDSAKQINLAPGERKVGYLFQNYALFPNMSVYKNIYFVAKGTKEERRAKTNEILARLHIEPIKNLYPHQISGGQQQRVALGRILVSESKTILLDEPFSALDAPLKSKLEQELKQQLKTYTGNVILVSHNKEEVYRICDYLMIMNKGMIECAGLKENVFFHPTSINSALLLEYKNISKITRKGDKFYATNWNDLELNIKQDFQYVAIHSYNLEISAAGQKFHVIEVIDEVNKKTLYLQGFESIIQVCVAKNYQVADSNIINVDFPKNKLVLWHEVSE